MRIDGLVIRNYVRSTTRAWHGRRTLLCVYAHNDNSSIITLIWIYLLSSCCALYIVAAWSLSTNPEYTAMSSPSHHEAQGTLQDLRRAISRQAAIKNLCDAEQLQDPESVFIVTTH